MIFWLTATSLSLISLIILVLKHTEDGFKSDIGSSVDAESWLTSIWAQVRPQGVDSADSDTESYTRFATNQAMPIEITNAGDLHGSLSNIPLIEMDENDANGNK